jgi:CheY-like chemotaxis protein
VHTAANAIDALEVWRTHRAVIDLLVTDMVMPGGVGGRELADRLRADEPRLRVLYCSGYTDEMLGGDLPLRNSPDFLEKPFDVHVFLERVRERLDRRSSA